MPKNLTLLLFDINVFIIISEIILPVDLESRPILMYFFALFLNNLIL